MELETEQIQRRMVKKYIEKEGTNEGKVLELLREGNELSGIEISEKTGIDRRNLWRIMKSLCKDYNIITRSEPGKTSHYLLVEEIQDQNSSPEPRMIYKAEFTKPSRYERFLDLVEKHGKIARTSLIRDFGFSPKHVDDLARRALQKGLIKKRKPKNRTHWIWAGINEEEIKEETNSLTETEILIRQIPTAKAFLKNLKNQRHPQSTINTYAKNLVIFYWFRNQGHVFKPLPVHLVTKRTIKDFNEFLVKPKSEKGKGYAISTQVNVLATLISYFDFCVKEGVLQESPMKDFDIPKVPEKPQVDIELEEFDAMVESVSELNSETMFRDITLMRFMLFGGLRVEELERFNMEDIRQEDRGVMVPRAKSAHWRFVPLEAKTLDMLNEYIKTKRTPLKAGEKATFLTKDGTRLRKITIQHLIKDIREKAGLKRKITCHSFRRGCATLLYERGFEPAEIQDILDHKSINTTMKYIKVKQKRIKESYKIASTKLNNDIEAYRSKKLKFEQNSD